MPDRIDFSLTHLDRLQGFFGRIEAKSSFLFAINLALLGSTALHSPLHHLCSWQGGACLLCGVLLVFSTINLYASYFPHLNSGRPSLLYFGDVAALSAADYVAQMKALTPEQLGEDALCQIWRNAQILRKKFARTKTAFILTGLAVPFWLFVLLTAAWRDGKFAGLG